MLIFYKIKPGDLLENREDVTNYINRLIRYTNGHIEDQYNGLNPEYLHFEWIKAKQTDYIVYQNNLKISKLYNFPFNVDYFTRGTCVTEGVNETIIRNISFDSNIELITIKDIDVNNKK